MPVSLAAQSSPDRRELPTGLSVMDLQPTDVPRLNLHLPDVHRVQAPASGVMPVFIGSVIGGLLPTTILAMSQIGSDQSPPPAGTLPAVWGAGAAAGAMLGAALGRRDVAPVWTTIATAAATAPFIIFAPDSDDWNGGLVFMLALPVTGAVIGNELGQRP